MHLSKRHQEQPNFIIETLGKFDVLKNGHSLVSNSSGSKKIWELYKFMLTHRDRSFTPESLSDQLWVSESYNDPRSTLRRQMHRLRQSLLEEDSSDHMNTLLFTNGYYKWNDQIQYQVDIDVFESLIKQGDLAKSNQPEVALRNYKEALSLYKGDYLPDCYDQHWVFSVRNHYRRLYLKTVTNAVELMRGLSLYDDMIEICQSAIKIDVYEEPFHIYLMEALYEKNQQKQALEHYEYITGFYYQEMGLKPSTEMKLLYKKLLKSHAPSADADMGTSPFESLESEITLENAFFCEPEVFKSIYELERRRSQRSKAAFSIGVVNISRTKGYSQSQEDLKLYRLKQHFMEHLRSGDTFTQWNESQMVILLPGVDTPLMEQILQRVLSSFPLQQDLHITQIKHMTADGENPLKASIL